MVGSWSTSSGSVTFYRNDFSTLGRCTIVVCEGRLGRSQTCALFIILYMYIYFFLLISLLSLSFCVCLLAFFFFSWFSFYFYFYVAMSWMSVKRHSEVRPVVRGSGRRITFTSRCQWWRAVSLFCRPGKFGPVAHACTREKKKEEEEPIARLKQREKSVPKENHARKQTAATPKWPWPMNRVRKGWDGQGLRWAVWTGGSRSFAVFEQWKREFIGDGTNTIWWKRYASAFEIETGRSRQAHHGDIRQQVLRIDEDRQQANSQHHCRRLPCWTTTTFRTSKRNLPSLSQTKWRSCENLSNRFSSFLGVHQMILPTFKSVNNVQVAGACGNSNPSPRIWAGPGCMMPSRPRRCAPRSGFALSSPHPRAGLLISDMSRDCCQGSGQSERELKGLWYPDHTRPGVVWFLDHNPLCHIWCG